MTTKDEVQVMIGLLYFAGHLNAKDVSRSDDTEVEISHLTMSLGRIRFLIRYLKVKKKRTRVEWGESDKLVAIRKYL